MSKVDSIDVIVAGGRGERLFPLTRDRTKPAVPFGGYYRIVDFVLNNLVNSGSRNILVAVQYKPASLKRHIQAAWKPVFEREGEEFISIVAPHGEGYQGNADAVFQNRAFLEEGPRLVGVFGADHVYLMDVARMKGFHLDNHADLTLAAIPRPIEEAKGLGVGVVNSRNELVDFREKQENPPPMPGSETHCLVSMGNYIFSRDELIRILIADSRKLYTQYTVGADPEQSTSRDFGRDIIPAMLRANKRIMVYDYRNNDIAGIRPEILRYWRDIGTISQYFQANMDLTGLHPSLVLANPQWQLVTHDESGGIPPRISGIASNSVIANGAVIEGVVEESVIGYNVRIGRESYVVRSVLTGNVRIGNGVTIRDAIIDKGAEIPDNMRIGLDLEQDVKRRFRAPENDKVSLVPRNYKP